MNCRDFEADVVDLARGAGTGATASLRTHLEQCDECAARLARERQLTTALKAAADSAPPSLRAASIEEHLLGAFAAQHAAAIPHTPAPRTWLTRPVAKAWLAAAAVVVLAVAGWQGAARWRSADGTTPVLQQAAASPSGPAPTPAGGEANSGAVAPGAAVEIPARPELRPAEAVPLVPAPVVARYARGRSAASPRQPSPAVEDAALRFVTLPTAIGLPAFESGRIVRVVVPTAMLPAYGLEVAPDSGAGMVEADVLVGQDGQPRAIRFVTFDPEPRRRQ